MAFDKRTQNIQQELTKILGSEAPLISATHYMRIGPWIDWVRMTLRYFTKADREDINGCNYTELYDHYKALKVYDFFKGDA